MCALGFYADISGVRHLLKEGDEAKVMSLIYGLGNVLYEIGEYSSKENIGRFFAYQMGDGFMVDFNNKKYSQENCHGTADDMVYLGVVSAQRFLIKHGGILRVGLAKGEIFDLSESGFKFATQANNNSGNGYRCGEGLFFILPITGTLLARAYSLVSERIPSLSSGCPRVLIDSNCLNSLSESLKKYFQEIEGDQKSRVWWYSKINDPDDENKKLYKQIWSEDIPLNQLKKPETGGQPR